MQTAPYRRSGKATLSSLLNVRIKGCRKQLPAGTGSYFGPGQSCQTDFGLPSRFDHDSFALAVDACDRRCSETRIARPGHLSITACGENRRSLGLLQVSDDDSWRQPSAPEASPSQ